MAGGGTVKAIVVSEFGGPEQLVLEDAPDPSPGPDQLLVAVEAAGLNFIDVYHRIGLYPLQTPFTPGVEGAGTVVSSGGNVTGVKPGDRVGWVSAIGSYAENVAFPAAKAIPIPDGVETSTVAALLFQGITAHYLATDTYPLTPGDRCLIHAGAGGVGLLLTQVAKLRGAEVFTTVGTEEKAELSRKAGADHVIVYTRDDFRDEVESIAGPRSIDVVYDGVGAATFMPSLDLLRPRGLMVSFGNASGPVPEITPLLLMRKGSLFLTRPTTGDYLQTREELLARCDDLFGWVEQGSLEVRIGAEYPLAAAAEAHRALEGRMTTGKVLLRP
jgi:NADPH2:quinone reductase